MYSRMSNTVKQGTTGRISSALQARCQQHLHANEDESANTILDIANHIINGDT